MIKEPIQIPSNQATSNQPADQPDESDELNKLSNIRIFEKSTMKERMKERTDQERRKEGTKEGREGRGWTGRKGRGRKEGTHGQMNECHNTLHAIMDEQTKKEENQSIDKSTNESRAETHESFYMIEVHRNRFDRNARKAPFEKCEDWRKVCVRFAKDQIGDSIYSIIKFCK